MGPLRWDCGKHLLNPSLLGHGIMTVQEVKASPYAIRVRECSPRRKRIRTELA